MRKHFWAKPETASVTGEHAIFTRRCARCGAEQLRMEPVHPRYAEPGDGRWLLAAGEQKRCTERENK